MFRVESVYVRHDSEPNDGDPFQITLSRSKLLVLERELSKSEDDEALELWDILFEELNR